MNAKLAHEARGHTVRSIVNGIECVRTDPTMSEATRASDLEVLQDELRTRIAIWQRRGHTYEEAMRILGLNEKDLR